MTPPKTAAATECPTARREAATGSDRTRVSNRSSSMGELLSAITDREVAQRRRAARWSVDLGELDAHLCSAKTRRSCPRWYTDRDMSDESGIGCYPILRFVLTDALPVDEVARPQGLRGTGPQDALLWRRVAGDENPLRDQVRRQVEHDRGS